MWYSCSHFHNILLVVTLYNGFFKLQS
jgi:hypothetical protein